MATNTTELTLDDLFSHAELQRYRIPDSNLIDMTQVLKAIEPHISQLLQDRSKWNSLYVDYQPPHLMRLWIQVGNIRVNLHYFIPTEEMPTEDQSRIGFIDNLYHPHAWASCMRILEGTYEQWIGFADRRGLDALPPKTLHLEHHQGDTYAMNHPWLWHQVIPIPNHAVCTLMVTYIPPNWDQDIPKPSKKLTCLTEEQKEFMFATFQKFFV